MSNKPTIFPGVPLDFHPDAVVGDLPGHQVTQSSLASIYGTAGTLLELERTVADRGKLKAAAKSAISRSTASINRGIAQLDLQAENMSNQIKEVLTERANHGQASEVRAHFKAQGNKAFTEIKKMIDEGEKHVVTAVLGAPFILSGLDRERFLTLWEHAAENFCPREQERMRAAIAGRQKLARAKEWFEVNMNAALNRIDAGDDAKLERLKPDAA